MGTTQSYLAVCAIFRDEAPYLREWIEFHRVVGAERFFLYDNSSSDDFAAVLAPYVDEGSVVVHEWPQEPGQLPAYEHCLRDHGGEARWIAFLDLDEFLFSPTGRPLTEILPEYERWPGVGVNWAMFGTSGHKSRPEGLVIESYVRRASDVASQRQIKSIVDPRRVAGCGDTPHYFVYRDGSAVDENQQPIVEGATERTSFARLRVNHYYLRSWEEALAKLANPKADTGALRKWRLEALDQRLSDQLDETIKVYAPPLRRALGLTGDPVTDPKASARGSGASQRDSPAAG